MNAHAVAPAAVDFSVSDCPAARDWFGDVEFMVMAGNGVIARLEPAGQELMKALASVKTERTPRGVSKAEGMACALVAVRMKVWWRASTVTIWAATERIARDLTSGAAPRYLQDGASKGAILGRDWHLRRDTDIL